MSTKGAIINLILLASFVFMMAPVFLAPDLVNTRLLTTYWYLYLIGAILAIVGVALHGRE